MMARGNVNPIKKRESPVSVAVYVCVDASAILAERLGSAQGDRINVAKKPAINGGVCLGNEKE